MLFRKYYYMKINIVTEFKIEFLTTYIACVTLITSLSPHFIGF